MWWLQVGLGFSGLSQLYGETIKSLSSAQRVFELIDRCGCICADIEAELAIGDPERRWYGAAAWLAGAVLTADARLQGAKHRPTSGQDSAESGGRNPALGRALCVSVEARSANRNYLKRTIGV